MFELRLQCPQAEVEIVSDALEALEAQSVSVEDSDAMTETEQPLFGEPGMIPTQSRWRWLHRRCCRRRTSLPNAGLSASRRLRIKIGSG